MTGFQPPLDVANKSFKIFESLQTRMDLLQVDLSIVVHQYVAEAGEALEPCCGGSGQDTSGV